MKKIYLLLLLLLSNSVMRAQSTIIFNNNSSLSKVKIILVRDKTINYISGAVSNNVIDTPLTAIKKIILGNGRSIDVTNRGTSDGFYSASGLNTNPAWDSLKSVLNNAQLKNEQPVESNHSDAHISSRAENQDKPLIKKDSANTTIIVETDTVYNEQNAIGSNVRRRIVEDPVPSVDNASDSSIRVFNPQNEIGSSVRRIYKDNEDTDEDTELSSQDMTKLGIKDANTFYNGYRGASTLTLLTTVGYLPIGLISAIVTSSTRPKPKNLGNTNSSNYKNYYYRNAYNMEAYKIKQRKVWSAFGLGLGILALAVIIVLIVLL